MSLGAELINAPSVQEAQRACERCRDVAMDVGGAAITLEAPSLLESLSDCPADNPNLAYVASAFIGVGVWLGVWTALLHGSELGRARDELVRYVDAERQCRRTLAAFAARTAGEPESSDPEIRSLLYLLWGVGLRRRPDVVSQLMGAIDTEMNEVAAGAAVEALTLMLARDLSVQPTHREVRWLVATLDNGPPAFRVRAGSAVDDWAGQGGRDSNLERLSSLFGLGPVDRFSVPRWPSELI